MKEVKQTLVISYEYTDKIIELNGIPQRVKNYYENNSRNMLTISIKTMSIKVPFKSTEFKDAIDYVNGVKPKGYDIYIHVCNPIRSHTAKGNVITYNSVTNAIHEYGHALGLEHANMTLNGIKKESKDPFDQMTSFAPYPSTNSVHRYLKGWFFEGEFLEVDNYPETIILGQLKNFFDKTSLKCLKKDNFFISFNEKDGDYYLCVHSLYGPKSSFLIKMSKLSKGQVITFDSMDFIVIELSDKILKLSISK